MSSLPANFERNSFLQIGDKAPDFVLKTDSGNEWRLSAQIGRVAALLFYPQDETLMCTKQMCSLRDNWLDYIKTKAVIVGISPGTIDQHKRFSVRHHLPLPLLVDGNREITKIYSRHWFMPINFTRAIVIVDAKGIIRHRTIMLRAFRPKDKSVLKSIYAARTDALQDKFNKLLKDSKARNENHLSG